MSRLATLHGVGGRFRRSTSALSIANCSSTRLFMPRFRSVFRQSKLWILLCRAPIICGKRFHGKQDSWQENASWHTGSEAAHARVCFQISTLARTPPSATLHYSRATRRAIRPTFLKSRYWLRRRSSKGSNPGLRIETWGTHILALSLIPHACQYAAHVGEALDDSGHGVVAVDFVFEIDVALVVDGNQCLEDGVDRHDAIANRDLALLAVEVGEVLHVHVEEARADLLDGGDHVGAGA